MKTFTFLKSLNKCYTKYNFFTTMVLLFLYMGSFAQKLIPNNKQLPDLAPPKWVAEHKFIRVESDNIFGFDILRIPVLFTSPDTTKVGIGTDMPQGKLDIRGSVRIGDFQNTMAWKFEESFAGGLKYLQLVNVNPDNTQSKNFVIETPGMVGIGISVPQAKLDVNGAIKVRGNISGLNLSLTGNINANSLSLTDGITATNLSLSNNLTTVNLTVEGSILASNVRISGNITGNALNITGNGTFGSLNTSSFTLADESQGNGKVLISDANGLASWVSKSTLDDGDWKTNADGNIYRDGSAENVKVGIATNNPQKALHVFSSHTIEEVQEDESDIPHDTSVTLVPPDDDSIIDIGHGSHYGIRLEHLEVSNVGTKQTYSTWDIEPRIDNDESVLSFVSRNSVNNGKDMFTIRASGKTGIGTLNPITRFHIKDDGICTLFLEGGTNAGSSVCFGNAQGHNWEIRAASPDNTTDPKTMTIEGFGSDKIVYIKNAKVGIGTNDADPLYKLDVCGSIRAKGIKINVDWCDFVFDKNYNLRTIPQLKTFIEQNGHLPNYPSGKEIEEQGGVEVSQSITWLLQSDEETKLYLIQMYEEMQQLKKENEVMKKQIEELSHK